MLTCNIRLTNGIDKGGIHRLITCSYITALWQPVYDKESKKSLTSMEGLIFSEGVLIQKHITIIGKTVRTIETKNKLEMP